LITENNLKVIKDFVLNYARPIDKSLYLYLFENLNIDDVGQELIKYQNEDGGFGKAIEPDFRLPDSSPMATTIGLQYARELQLPQTHPIIINAVKYLLKTYNKKQRRWFSVPEEVNNYPHAPWWHVNEETKNAGVESNWANPNAEIVGYLVQYSDLVPSDFLEEVLEIALLKFVEDVQKMEMHDLLCYIKLFEVLPEDHTRTHIKALVNRVKEIVQTTKEAWENYGPKPLTFAPSPHSLLYPYLKEEIQLNLQYEIEQLNENGYCEPNWAWGQFEKAWLTAKEEWKGSLTVKTIKILDDYGQVQRDKASE
jgi:hypothetical protein